MRLADASWPTIDTIYACLTQTVVDTTPRRLRSIGRGGAWSNPTTWNLGRVPTFRDTAWIAPGSMVRLDANPTVRRLEVGGGQAPACLQMNLGTLTATRGILIGHRDSVVSTTFNASSTLITLGNIEQYGIIETRPPSTSSLRLAFGGSSPQRWFGSFDAMIDSTKKPIIIFDNPTVVNVELPVRTTDRVVLLRGTAHMIAPFKCVSQPTINLPIEPAIDRVFGRVSGSFTVSASRVWYTYLRPGNGSDSNVVVGNEWPTSMRAANIQLRKAENKRVIVPPGRRMSNFFGNRGILQAQDTLRDTLLSTYASTSSSELFWQADVLSLQDTVRVGVASNINLNHCRRARCRKSRLYAPNRQGAPANGSKLFFRMLDPIPGGQFSPGLAPTGRFMMEYQCNRPTVGEILYLSP